VGGRSPEGGRAQPQKQPSQFFPRDR
jgi:hypothetical protein